MFHLELEHALYSLSVLCLLKFFGRITVSLENFINYAIENNWAWIYIYKIKVVKYRFRVIPIQWFYIMNLTRNTMLLFTFYIIQIEWAFRKMHLLKIFRKSHIYKTLDVECICMFRYQKLIKFQSISDGE